MHRSVCYLVSVALDTTLILKLTLALNVIVRVQLVLQSTLASLVMLGII